MLASSDKIGNTFCNQPIAIGNEVAGAREFVVMDAVGGSWNAPEVMANGTVARLERVVRPFRPSALRRRHFASPDTGLPEAGRREPGRWHEGSKGDSMHKLLLVLAGQVDVEGGAGGWLVLPNHLILIPADRQFNLRTVEGTVVDVAHLDPDDALWHHEGCWVTVAPTLAYEMLAYVSRADVQPDARRHAFRSLSHMCFDWFANPRMLFVPAAQSDELKAVVAYIGDNLCAATVAGAADAAGLPQRTLHRRCQTEMGFGLRTLIREVRIMRAMELLAGRDVPIQDVAHAVGFASVPSFTAAFSERLGLSPGEYMRNSRSACAARLGRG